MFSVRTTCVLVLLLLGKCLGEFIIPDVILEAYTPKGFRASIQDTAGTQLFAFHANLNKDISPVEPAEYTADVTKADNSAWSYFNEDLELKVGDKISYWFFIQHDKLGYRRDNQKWTVKTLVPYNQAQCNKSTTQDSGKISRCVGEVLLEDNFPRNDIDTNNWMVEQFIPFKGPDFEFVSYQNRKDVCYVQDSKLFLKPKVAETEQDLRGTLDLSHGCTRSSTDECVYTHYGAFLIPPVTSARIVSKLRFRHGVVEIKAKLPEGDWIYPQIYLEQVEEPNRKLWIAYARGNDILTSSSEADDIGGRLLFGGPVLQPTEPLRSKYLRSHKQGTPLFNDFHTYKVIWTQDEITLWLDGAQYGSFDKEEMRQIKFSDFDMVRLVLGVGVGGINDFPDGYVSNDRTKPWVNRDRTQVKRFFTQKDSWIKTWRGVSAALQVDSVKISAV